MKIEDPEHSVAGYALPQTAVLAKRSVLRKFLTFSSLILADWLGWSGALVLAGGLALGAFSRSISLLGWFPLLGSAFLAFEGLYTQRRAYWDEVRGLWRGCTLAHFAALPATLYSPLALPPLILFISWVLLLIGLPLLRLGTKSLLIRLGLWRKRLLILGAGPAGRLALEALEDDPLLGYEVIGFLDDHPSAEAISGRRGPIPILGPLGAVPQVLEATQAQDVLIALPDLSQAELLALIQRLYGQPGLESVRIMPNLGFLSLMEVRIDQLLPKQLFLVTTVNNLAKPWNRWLKRLFDLVAGSGLTLLALPFMGLIAWLIRRDTPGPILYVHERIGQGGRPFRCLKFRTMHLDGEERLKSALAQDLSALWEWEVYRKLRLNDPRVTRVGRFLRRWSLDELPQLFNVLKGEMSLIGPRPYLVEERELAGPDLNIIVQTKPGITGLWQVSGKNQIPFRERVQLEAWYVRNWSFWLDIIIAIRTVRVVLEPEEEGVY